MIRFAEWLGHWSVDVYLLGSILLLLSLLAMTALRQPVHRLAVVKSLLIGLVLLAGLCAVPGWSALHLMTAKPEIAKEVVQPVAPIAVPAISPDNLPSVEPPPISVAPVAQPAARVEIASHISFRPWAVAGAIELIGAIGVILWLAAGWLIARTLRRRSHDARPHVQQLLSRIAEATSFSRNFVPNVLVCDQFDVPVALGLRRPVIVLPARLLEPRSASEIPQAELSTVLAHELAHVQNLDLAWLALSRGLLAVFWAQPLYWLTRRRMRLDQESLADAAAAELTSRERYAEQLVGWARNLADTYTLHVASAVGLWEGASQLRQRVALLLDERITVLRQFSRNWQLAMLAVCTLIAASLSLVTLQPAQSQTRNKTGGSIQSSIPTPAPDMPFEKRTVAPNSIAVRVLDENGQPIKTQRLDLLRVEVGNGRPATNMVAAITNNDGTAIIDDVISPNMAPFFQDYPDGKIEARPGMYGQLAVLVKSPGHASFLYPFNEVEVFNHGVKADIRLQKSASLKGRVTNTKDEPVAGATVTTSAVDIPGFQTTTTDADGRYELADATAMDLGGPPEKAANASESDKDRVDVFQLNLVVRHPDYAEKLVPFSRIPGTVDARLEPGGVIEGRVVMPSDDWQPINNGMRVCAYPAPLKDAGEIGEARLPAYTGADRSGHFHLGPLRAGRYRLFCEKPGWFNPNVNAGLPDIEVRVQETTAAPDLQLSEGSVAHVELIYSTSHQPISLANETRGVATIVPDPATNGRTADVAINVSKSGHFDIRMPAGKCGLSVSVGDWSATANEHAMFDVPAKGSADVKLEVSKKPQQAGDRTFRDKPVSANAKPATEEVSAVPKETTAGTGSLTIRFEYEGTPPARKELKEYIWRAKIDDSELGRIDVENVAGSKVFDESLVVGQDRGIANVLIWVRSKNVPAPPADNLPPTTIKFEKGRVSPHVSAFQGPRELVWRNENTTPCSFVYEKTLSSFGRLLQAGEQASCAATIDESPVRVWSSTQPWARGWVLVLPNPYVGVSDEHGVARIENLPPGKWEFQVWHERTGWLKAIDWPRGRFETEIKAGENDLGTKKLSPLRSGLQPDTSAAQAGDEKHADGGSTSAGKSSATDDGNDKSADLSIVVAKRAMLLGGKEIVTWDDIESKIAALPNPSKAVPHFYFTNGVIESGGQQAAHRTIYELHRKYKLAGHSEGTLLPRAGLRYDRIEKPSDLVPDESLRVEGTVVDSQGKPVAGAEVVLITPIDPAVLPYTTYDIALVKGQLRNRLDEVCTETDAAGRFAIYPAKGQKYCLLGLHPESGINVARSDGFAGDHKISLLPWATVEAKLDQDGDPRQTASLITRIREQDGYPAVNLSQYWSDLKQVAAKDTFRYSQVPAILETDVNRACDQGPASITVSGASVSLLPGENRQIDLGTLSDKQREYLKDRRDKFGTEEHASSGAKAPSAAMRPPAEAPKADQSNSNTVSGRVVDENNHPLVGAAVFLSRVNYEDGTRKQAAETKTDADGWFWFKNVLDLTKEFPDGKFPPSYLPDVNMPEAVVRAPGRISSTWLMSTTVIAKSGYQAQVQMLPASTLWGRVTNGSGKPVEGALVSIEPPGAIAHGEGVPSCRTDADGNYKIDDAAGFDLADYKKQVADDAKQGNSPDTAQPASFRLHPVRPVLVVKHPDYAMTQATFDKCPGTKDVQLDAAATLAGRVIFADSGRPATGVVVWAATSIADKPTTALGSVQDIQRIAVRTDAEGKYRIGSLAAGKYDLWAEAPGWVNVGLNDVAAAVGKDGAVPDLPLVKGGTVSARLVDAKTRKPIDVKPSTHTMILVRPPAEARKSVRTLPAPTVEVNSAGRFALNLAPGKTLIGAGGVELDGNLKFSGLPTVEATVVDGQTVEVDLPVSEVAPLQLAAEVTTLEESQKDAAKTSSSTKTARKKNDDGSRAPADSHNGQTARSSRRPRPNSISGQVTDEQKQPLANAKVSIFRIDNKTGERALLKSASTNDKGQFAAEDVLDLKKEFPNGRLPPLDDFSGALLQVYIQAPGRATYSWLQSPQLVAKWGDTQLVPLELAEPLHGRVLTSDGKPVAGAMVSVGQSGPSLGFAWAGAQSARTDTDGNYTISDVGPFDLQNYRDEREAAAHRNQPPNAEQALHASRYLMPPKLNVEHPDYAVKQTDIEKIPGTKDVTLDPAAVLTGRVIFADSGKPAAGALVHAGGNLQRFTSDADVSLQNGAVQVHYRYPSFTSSTCTDAEGNYRFASLPVGYYRVWANLSGWQSADVGDLAARAGTTQSAPDIKLVNGGTLSVALKDSKTGKPLQVDPDTTATLGVQPGPGSNRPIIQQGVTANADGRFHLQLPPGEATVFVGNVAAGDNVKWVGTAGEAGSRTLVTIEDGKTTKLELPVIDIKSAQITGTFQVAPAEEPKAASPSAQ